MLQLSPKMALCMQNGIQMKAGKVYLDKVEIEKITTKLGLVVYVQVP